MDFFCMLIQMDLETKVTKMLVFVLKLAGGFLGKGLRPEAVMVMFSGTVVGLCIF